MSEKSLSKNTRKNVILLHIAVMCFSFSGVIGQYVQQWLPIVAAAQLSKENELEKDFLMRWIDVVDYQ